MIIFGQVIGTLGMILVCLAFYLAVSGKYSHNDNTYLLTNLVGAVLLLISLLITFNLGSFLIEIFWIAIAVKGLYSNWRSNRVNNS